MVSTASHFQSLTNEPADFDKEKHSHRAVHLPQCGGAHMLTLRADAFFLGIEKSFAALRNYTLLHARAICPPHNVIATIDALHGPKVGMHSDLRNLVEHFKRRRFTHVRGDPSACGKWAQSIEERSRTFE
jgi:hypothetical protein